MLKAAWNDLLARFPEPYLLVAVLPGSSEKESIDNAQSAQRLLVRLIRSMDLAVEVSYARRGARSAFGVGEKSTAGKTWLRGVALRSGLNVFAGGQWSGPETGKAQNGKASRLPPPGGPRGAKR